MARKENVYFKQSNLKLDGFDMLYHNRDMDTFYANPNIDTTVKIIHRFTYHFLNPKNKDKNTLERVYELNTSLAKLFNVTVSTVQKAIRNAVQIGVISKRYYVGAGGALVDHDDNPNGGLTQRYVELNTGQLKDLFRAMPKDKTYKKYNKRSRERRFALQRAMTLIDNPDLVIQLINEAVIEDIKTTRTQYNSYVANQFAKYTNQEPIDLDQIIEATENKITSERRSSLLGDLNKLLDIERVNPDWIS